MNGENPGRTTITFDSPGRECDPEAVVETIEIDLNTLPAVMGGNLDVVIDPLVANFQAEKLKDAVEAR
jgi:hypothetical protein